MAEIKGLIKPNVDTSLLDIISDINYDIKSMDSSKKNQEKMIDEVNKNVSETSNKVTNNEKSLLKKFKESFKTSKLMDTLNFFNIEKKEPLQQYSEKSSSKLNDLFPILNEMNNNIAKINKKTTLENKKDSMDIESSIKNLMNKIEEVFEKNNKILESVLSSTNKPIKNESKTSSNKKKNETIYDKIISTFTFPINAISSMKKKIVSKLTDLITYPKTLFEDIRVGLTKKISGFLELPKKIFSNITSGFSDFFSGFKNDKNEKKSEDDLSYIIKKLDSIEDLMEIQLENDENERKRLLREKKDNDKKKDSSFLGGLLGGLFVTFISKFKNLFKIFTGNFFKLANKIPKLLTPIKKFFSIFKGFGSTMLGFTKGVGNTAFAGIKRFFSFFKSFGSKIFNFTKGVGSSAFAGIKGIFSSFAKIKSFLSPLKMLSKFGNILKPIMTLSKSIPIIGWIITGLTSITDFFSGFSKTEGSIFEKIIGGFKGLINGLQDTFIGIPLKILEWTADKIAGIFDIKIEEGWADKTTEWIKNITNEMLDWVTKPMKDLYEWFSSDKKTEDTSKTDDMLSKFKEFFNNIGKYLSAWIKENPVVKSASWLWEKVTGKPLFDEEKVDVPESKEEKQLPTDVLPKDDVPMAALENIDRSKQANVEDASKKSENRDAIMKELNKTMNEMSGNLNINKNNEALLTNSSNSSSNSITVPSITTVNNTSKNNIPEGIESLGLLLKNSTWGF